MVFRFDDISLNTDMAKANAMKDFLISEGHEVMWAISLICFYGCGERVFPNHIKPYSDVAEFFDGSNMGIPDHPPGIKLASHGLFHVDHRLLNYEAQKMSIIGSCNIIGTSVFVPPFNKWNKDTEKVCEEYSLDLIKYEDGWLSCEHNRRIKGPSMWYLHPQCWTLETFKTWYGAVVA